MSFARVRALVVVGVLILAAVIFVVVAIVRDSQAEPNAKPGCPAGWPVANIALPEPKEVKVKVFNGSTKPGAEFQVTEDFKNREFRTEKPNKSGKAVNGVAILRYGPKAVGGAHLLRGYFLDAAEIQYDPKRASDAVDVIIGKDFAQLATTTEVKQSLATLGRPELPKGACAAEES
ncbi:MAG TPA: LytR C-terminal domain-containing protein [Catenuloplanes sp.]|jgi:hypothetical protein